MALSRSLIIGLICLQSSLFLQAQSALDHFGKNGVQYEAQAWQYISSANFDLYYDQAQQVLAEKALVLAEEELVRIERLTGFSPSGQIKILLYASLEELQQSNRQLEAEYTSTGGVTRLVKSRVEIAFRGSHELLRRDISHALAEMAVDITLYGGSLKDVLANAYLLSLPEWFSRGLATYLAEGWSSEMDSRIRALSVEEGLKNPALYEGEQAELIGQSIFNYISVLQGERTLAPILSLTHAMRDAEIGIENTIDIAYPSFIANWRAFYNLAEDTLQSHYQLYGDSLLYKTNRRLGKEIISARVSPDGKHISVVSYERGKCVVRVQPLSGDKRKKLLVAGLSSTHYEKPLAMPVVSWRSDSMLLIAAYQKGTLKLFQFDVDGRQISERTLDKASQVNTIQGSRDGSLLALTVGVDGQSDLFVYDFKRDALTRITNDWYDEADACFGSDNNELYFISNRPTGTISSEMYLPENSVVFHLGLNQLESEAVRVYGYGTSRRLAFHNEQLYVLNNERGVYNVSVVSVEGNLLRKTNSFIDVLDFTVDNSTGQLYAVTGLHDQASLFRVPKIQEQVDYLKIPLTARAEKVYSAKPSYQQHYSISRDERLSDSTEFAPDIEDMIFEGETRSSAPSRVAVKHTSTKPYRLLLSTDKVTSAIAVDPLRGLGVLLESGMSDLFGDHRVDLGIFFLTDFQSSSIYGQYQYLKKRIDIKARYERYSLYMYNELTAQAYTRNDAEFTLSYPFSKQHRISASSTFTTTRFSDQSNTSTLAVADTLKHYPGLRLDWVFDNTRSHGFNMPQGTRVKVTLLQNVALEGKANNFGRLGIDLRHYQPIHKELVFALRASGGAFLGPAKKSFLLGGMDNWFLNSTDNASGSDSPLNIDYLVNNSDLLFVRYVTNMRGFNYNAQYGSRYLLLNAELRWPIVLYLTQGTVSSNLLRNLQLATFCDIGSAWSSGSPFSKNNSVNTQYINANPYQISVVNYRSPFLVGFGGGVRTVFLGYYTKADVAWGIKDGQLQSGVKFYLTLGYDF